MERQDTASFNPKASFLRDDDADPPDQTAADRAPAKKSSSFGRESFNSDTAEEGASTEPKRRAHFTRALSADFTRALSSYTVGAGASARLRRADASSNEVAAEVAATVKARFRDQLPASLAKDYDQRDSVGPFRTHEIVLGPKLGSGEFSHVFEIRAFRPDPATVAGVDAAELETREHMKSREKYRDTNKACYAVKHLRQELLRKYDTLEYAQAASDLMQEAEFLAALQHPNIVKLRGVAFDGARGFLQGPKGYFLIIDRLNDTLDKRLRAWSKARTRARRGSVVARLQRKFSGVDEEEASDVTEERLEVALHIASALCFLHQKHVMFRDLKPDNIGFDVRGDVKLFDFGLATFLPPEGDPYEDRYEMSGAGSPRYMAPEVLGEVPEHYNLKGDVYAFGIVLWEILSLRRPFSQVRSRQELVDEVVGRGGRPELNSKWSERIQESLTAAFDADMGQRPTMKALYDMLRAQLVEMRGGDDGRLRHTFLQRRRSTFVRQRSCPECSN